MLTHIIFVLITILTQILFLITMLGRLVIFFMVIIFRIDRVFRIWSRTTYTKSESGLLTWSDGLWKKKRRGIPIITIIIFRLLTVDRRILPCYREQITKIVIYLPFPNNFIFQGLDCPSENWYLFFKITIKTIILFFRLHIFRREVEVIYVYNSYVRTTQLFENHKYLATLAT